MWMCWREQEDQESHGWMKMMVSSKESEKLKKQNTINEYGRNKYS